MKLSILVAAAVALGGCMTVQARSSATADFPAADQQQALKIAIQAAMGAGFTIGSSNMNSGMIVATRGANSMLTWSNPTINILTTWRDGMATLTLASTVGGQMVDYGTTKATMTDFCAALLKIEPKATCAAREG